MMGDLNARTGTSSEYVEFSLDSVATDQYGIDDDVISYLNNAQELRNYGIQGERNSQDKTRNNFGNVLLQICRNNNLYICNGRLNSENTSAYTCIKGSVIDYLIANINSILLVNKFTVHEFSPLLSDVHCALSFAVTVHSHIYKTEKPVFNRIRWEADKKESFINNINRNKITELNLMLDNAKFRSLNINDIDNLATKVKLLFQESANVSFKRNSVVTKKVKNKPWFG